MDPQNKNVSALGINTLLLTTVQCSDLKLFASFKHFPFQIVFSWLWPIFPRLWLAHSFTFLTPAVAMSFFIYTVITFLVFYPLVWHPVCHISFLRHRGDWKKTPWFERKLAKVISTAKETILVLIFPVARKVSSWWEGLLSHFTLSSEGGQGNHRQAGCPYLFCFKCSWVQCA